MNQDLTVGKPENVLWKFCLPLFGSIIFQQLYNIADSLVAGKFIHEEALAAVGNSYEITLIFLAFAFGCNIGCSVIVSQLFGAKNYNDMKTSIYTSIIASTLLCLVLMGLGISFCDDLLALIHTQDAIWKDSKLYLDIYIWGLPFLFLYNIATGIFSALGDSKTPFIFLAISSTTNIFADILFVTAFDMGVAGIAWATFICQGVSCILAMIVVLKRLKTIPTEGSVRTFSFTILKKVTRIALPSILQQSFISIGNMIIQSIINDCGVQITAGYAAAIKLNNLVITSLTTLGNGISNYTAQNLGANIFPRIKAGFKAGIKLVWIICIPLVLLYVVAGRYLITFFIDNPSERTLLSGVQFLMIVAPFYFVISVKLVADGILRGAGLMKQFMISTFTDLVLRVLLAFLLSNAFGYIGIWCAWPIGWSIAMGLSVLFYKKWIDSKCRECSEL